MIIPIDMVEAGTRLRAADPEQVAALATSIAEVGLLSPITVYARRVIRAGIEVQGWGIVAGLHRLEACRSLGLIEIEAAITDLPELKRQIAECDENLCGTKLTQAQRAMFTARRKQAYEALHPETRAHVAGAHGANRALGNASANFAPAFTTDTATRTGKAERTIELDARRGERIDEEVLSSVAGTKLDTGRTLDALAAVPRQEQKAELVRIQEASRVKPAPVPLNEFETMEQWIAAGMRWWNRGAEDWRDEFKDRIDRPVFDQSRLAQG